MSETAKSLREAGEDVLLLDAGGFFPQVPLDDGDLKKVARAGMAAAAEMGYEALNVAPGDLSQGAAFLRAEAERAGLPLLAANMIEKSDGRPFGREYLLVSRGGFSVGVVGVVSGQDGEFLGRLDPSLALAVRPPADALRAVVPKMRKEGADLVVLLFNGGSVETEALMRSVGGIDVAVYRGRNPAPGNLAALAESFPVFVEPSVSAGCSTPPTGGTPALEDGRVAGLYRGDLKRETMGYLRVVRDETGEIRVDRARVVNLHASLGEEPRVAALIDMDVEAILKGALAERDRRMEQAAREMWKTSPLDMIRRSVAKPDVKGE